MNISVKEPRRPVENELKSTDSCSMATGYGMTTTARGQFFVTLSTTPAAAVSIVLRPVIAP